MWEGVTGRKKEEKETEAEVRNREPIGFMFVVAIFEISCLRRTNIAFPDVISSRQIKGGGGRSVRLLFPCDAVWVLESFVLSPILRRIV